MGGRNSIFLYNCILELYLDFRSLAFQNQKEDFPVMETSNRVEDLHFQCVGEARTHISESRYSGASCQEGTLLR